MPEHSVPDEQPPAPKREWQPGDLSVEVWDAQERRWATWLCDVEGEPLVEAEWPLHEWFMDKPR